jgi:serine/threonine protein kinase
LPNISAEVAVRRSNGRENLPGGPLLEAATTCSRCDAPAPSGKNLCARCETSQTFEEIPGGRYEIVSCLGTGAFGSVYRAQDTFLNRDVAVKSIRLDTTLDPEHRKALNRRFIREAQVAAQLHHPNIVTIHDIIFTPETGFIVMEFIEGTTLQSVLKKERLPLPVAIEVTAQVGSALQYAHEHKIIHRDIKPANIMITPSYEARITDFGIAKSDGSTHLTMSGSLVGTPDYMSPEQAKGEEADGRSDIFSLGCVLYECAVGEKPFKGGSLTGVLLSIVNSDPLQSKAFKALKLPAELEAVLSRALSKDPDQRYLVAAELVAALRGLPVAKLPASTAPSPARESVPSLLDLDDRTVIVPPEDPAAASLRDERLRRLKDENRPLKFAAKISDELQDMSLTPAQGFILSRIDGVSMARDILTLSPMPEAEVAETLADLLDKGLLTLGEDAPKTSKSGKPESKRRAAKPSRKKTIPLDSDLEREMERLLELGENERYSELLGVEEGTATVEVKQSYRDLVDRFHPEAHPENIVPSDLQKLSKVVAVATEALTALTAHQPPDKKEASPSKAAKPKVAKPKAASRPGFDPKRYAEDLFQLAQKAYATTDFWEAIQLARQAIELDAEKAEYHHLLGLGLMKNRNWLKEAEECLRKATELDPSNPEYFGLLASVYKAEGLPENSAAMLEKARSLDPGYC